MNDNFGCFSIAATYCLGTYLFTAAVVVVGGWQNSYLIAPLTAPFLFFFGFLLVGNSEVPVDPTVLAISLVMWGMFIVAAYGLVKSYHEGVVWRWPIVLLLVLYTAQGVWIWRH